MTYGDPTASDSVCSTLSDLAGRVDNNAPLWELSFDVDVVLEDEERSTNVFCCSGPRFELDYDASVAEARRVFGRMYPGEEFLPRAPEPDEIIVGGGDDERHEEDAAKGDEGHEGDAAKVDEGPVEDAAKGHSEDAEKEEEED